MSDKLFTAWVLGMMGGFALGWAMGPLIDRLEALMRAKAEDGP
jgi:hypothetical protein